MLTKEKACQTVHELQSEPKKFYTLMRWIGGRKASEIETIVARSIQYSSYFFELYPKEMKKKGEVQRWKWSFLVAAHELQEEELADVHED